jgi:hypothetical protein
VKTAIVLICGLLALSFAQAAENGTPVSISMNHAKSVLKKNGGILLQLKGVQEVTIVSCDARTGELIPMQIPLMKSIPCIGVRLASQVELSRVEETLPNPMVIDNVIVHFTDKDFDGRRGGITISN